MFLSSRLVAALCLGVACAGCVDANEKVVLNPDGSGRFTVDALVQTRALVPLRQALGRVTARAGADMDPDHMLLAMIRSARGVDVWTTARVETTAAGEAHYELAGYFRKFAAFRAPNVLSAVGEAFGMDSTVFAFVDVGRADWTRVKGGNIRIDYDSFTSEKHHAAGRAGAALPPLTPEEQQQVTSNRMMFTMMNTVLSPLLEHGRVRFELAVPGTIVDSGLFSAPERDRATLAISLHGMLDAVGTAVQSDTLSRWLLASARGGGRDSSARPDFQLPAAFDTLMSVRLFGRCAPMRLEFHPGAPRFDYAAERAAALAARPAGLDERIAAASAERAPAGAGEVIREPEFNCAFTVPPGWSRYQSEKAALPGTISIRRGALIAMLVPEKMAVADLATVGDALLGNFTVRYTLEHSTSERVTRAGLPYLHMRSVLSQQDEPTTRLYIEHWITARGGFVWPISTIGIASDSLEVHDAARLVVAGFQVLDTTVTVERPADVDRPQWGYALRGAEPGWSVVPPSSKHSALIDLFLTTVTEGVAIVPLRFEGAPPDLPALTRGLIAVLDLKEKAGAEYRRGPWQTPLGEGQQLGTDRTVDGAPYHYTLRIARGRHAAFMLAGWWRNPGGDSARVQRTLDAIVLREPTGPGPALAATQRTAFGLALNDIALSYGSRDDHASAAAWHRAAFEQAGRDPVLLYNVGFSLRANGRDKEALAYLAPRLEKVEDRADLRQLVAELQLAAGDTLVAQRSFLRATDLGLDDEDVLYAWASHLSEQGRPDLGEQACAAWEARHPTVNVRRWHAELVREQGDTTRALGMMRALAAEHPEDLGLGHALARTLFATGDFTGAADVARRLLASNPDDVRSLLDLGWTQMARLWYREAKATFEKAVKLAPDDTEAATGVRRANEALGQGDHVNTTTPLAAVPLPNEIRDAAAARLPALFGQGYPAVTLLNAHGYQFAAGQPVRHTLHRRYKVLTQAGAASYGTLEFPFHPGRERIYINHIEVRDSTGGAPVTSANEDAYVIDPQNSIPDGSKVLHAQVQGVKPGCTIDVQLTYEYLDARTPFEFERVLFADGNPDAVMAVYLAGDTTRVHSDLAHGAGVRRVARRDLAAWIAQPAYLERREPWSTRLEDRAPRLALGPVDSSWASSARAYLSDLRALLAPDAQITALAGKLTAGATTDRERIARLARHVQQQVQYRAVAFGPRARIPLAAGKVLAQRFGDCKEQALLLHQLLTAAGIHSALALVNTEWRIVPALPSLDQFDHMVVMVPALGPDWLLDPTDKTLQLEAYRAHDLGQSHALLLDAADPRLIAPAGHDRSGVELASRSEVHADGRDWVVHEVVTMGGYEAAWYRGYFQRLNESDRQQNVQNLLDAGGSAQVRKVDVGELEDPAAPVVLTIDYVLPNAITPDGTHASAAVPCLLARRFMAVPFVADRSHEFELDYPLHVVDDVVLKLPAPPTRGGAAGPVHGETAFDRWEVSRTAGTTPSELELHLEFQGLDGIHPPARYREFRDAWAAPIDALGARIEW